LLINHLLCENRQTEGRIGEDGLARVAVIAVPANTVLVSWPGDKTPAPLWGGVVMKAGEMMSLGPGNRVHARTGGPSRWHAIRVPKNDLLCYGRALCGAGFIVPPGLALWRPSPATAVVDQVLEDIKNLRLKGEQRASAPQFPPFRVQGEIFEGVEQCVLPR